MGLMILRRNISVWVEEELWLELRLKEERMDDVERAELQVLL
jgi:hypothetical protein